MMYEAAELDDTYLPELKEYFTDHDMDLAEFLDRIIVRSNERTEEPEVNVEPPENEGHA